MPDTDPCTIINSGNNFQIQGSGNNQIFFNGSYGRLGINTNSPSTVLHIVGKCSNDSIRLESTTPCPTGVALTMFHNPSTGSEVGDYPAIINLAGRNGNGQQVNYAQIKSKILGTNINNTSGELIFAVDSYGIPTDILTFNPQKTTIGLNSKSRDSDAIVIGTNAYNIGIRSVIVGHNSKISGVYSSDNILLGHNSNYSGSSSLIASHNSDVIGSNLYVLGSENFVAASYMVNVGDNNSIDSTISGIVQGSNNTLSNSSGIVIGYNNNITGNKNTVMSLSSNVYGTGNIILGNNITNSGNNNFIIGKNITSTSNESVVLGITNQDLIINNQSVIINSGLRNIGVNIFGSSSSYGLFFRNNKLGINTIPSAYVLDVSGSVRAESLYVDRLRLGSAVSETCVLSADTLGNASWKPVSSLQQTIDNGTPNSIMFYNNRKMASVSGLYWNAFSGVLYTTNSNTIIPTGNRAFVINNTKQPLSNIFNIKGANQDSLFVVDAKLNNIGINTDNPSHNLHVSGSVKFYKDNLSFIEKNDNEFIIAYDVGSSKNRLVITSSGIIVDQDESGTIFSQQSYSKLYPTKIDSDNIKIMVWDTNDNKWKHASTIVAGFDSFTGISDS
jgi:hypothetical protein